jgi:hypothetical protein
MPTPLLPLLLLRSPAARINIDVLVTDGAGKPVSALEPPDFGIFDNDQPRKVLGFGHTDAFAGTRIDPPEVIVVLDAVNLPYQTITLQRLQLKKFLRQNDGKLAMPTSIFIFSEPGPTYAARAHKRRQRTGRAARRGHRRGSRPRYRQRRLGH